MKKGPEFDQLPTPLRDFLQKEARGDIPFWSTIGMETMDAKTGWSRVRVRFSRVLINSNGVLHGGIVFSAADAATAVALLSLLKEGERMATAEMKINFLRPVDDIDIVAEARILHRGAHTAVGDVTVWDAAGNLVAKALATYAIAKKTEGTGRKVQDQKRRTPKGRKAAKDA